MRVEEAGHYLRRLLHRVQRDEDKLTKPGKCPSCRNSRIFEPQIAVHQAHRSS